MERMKNLSNETEYQKQKFKKENQINILLRYVMVNEMRIYSHFTKSELEKSFLLLLFFYSFCSVDCS